MESFGNVLLNPPCCPRGLQRHRPPYLCPNPPGLRQDTLSQAHPPRLCGVGTGGDSCSKPFTPEPNPSTSRVPGASGSGKRFAVGFGDGEGLCLWGQGPIQAQAVKAKGHFPVVTGGLGHFSVLAEPNPAEISFGGCLP